MSHVGQVFLKKPTTLLALKLNLQGGSGPNSAYQKILDYATSQGYTLPSTANQIEQNALVTEMQNSGIWDGLDVFYNFFTDGSADFAKINWINPGTYQVIAVGPPVFTANSGFKGNGTSQYLNTQFAPTNGDKYKLGDSSMFHSMGLNVRSQVAMGSVEGSTYNIVMPRFDTQDSYFGTNSLQFATYNAPDATGLWITSNNNSKVDATRNGVIVATAAATPSILIDRPVFILARNDGGVPKYYSNNLAECAGMGASLMGLESTLYDLWFSYKTMTLATAAYSKIIDYATAQGFSLPNIVQRRSQIGLIYNLIAGGVWDDLDVFYNFVTDGDADFAKINWKNPGTYQAVGTGHEPTFVVNDGFKGNGSGQYLDTQFTPSVNSSKYTTDDASAFLSLREVISGNHGAQGSSGDSLLLFTTGSSLSYKINQGAKANSTQAAPADSLIHIQRTGPSEEKIFINAIDKSAGKGASGVLPDAKVYLLAKSTVNAPSTYSNNTIMVFGLGASLAGKEQALYDAWKIYHDTWVGAIYPYDQILNYAIEQGYTLPSEAQQTLQRELLSRMIVVTIWDKLDVFYNFYTDGDENFAKINWKNPGANDAIVTDCSFTVNSGFKRLSTSNNNGISVGIPSSWAVNFTTNEGSFGGDARIPASGNTDVFGQLSSTTQMRLLMSAFGQSFISWPETGTSVQIQNASNFRTSSFHLSQRKAGISKYFGNGLQSGGSATALAPAAFDTINPLIAIRSIGQGVSIDITCASLFAGASLEGLEDNFYQIWTSYKENAIGQSAYEKIIAYATAQGYALPSAQQQVDQDALIQELIDAGIWDKLDVFYNFYTDGDIDFAKINWKNPGTYQIPAGGGFTANTGLFPSLALTTGYTPSGNWTLNDASWFEDFEDTRVRPTTQSGGILGNLAASNIAGSYFDSAPNIYTQWCINEAIARNTVLGANTDKYDFLLHIQRVSSSVSKVFKNGAQQGNNLPQASSAVPTTALSLAANLNLVSRCFGAGASLSGLEAYLYEIWGRYKNNIIKATAYKAIIDYATAQGFTLPSVAQQELQKVLLDGMIDAGIWQKLDVFYNFFTNGSADFAKINWKNPGTYQSVGTGHEPTFIPNSGFKGNGTTQWLDHVYKPSTNGVNWQLDNAGVFTDCITDTSTPEAKSILGGGNTTSYRMNLSPINDPTNSYFRLNSNGDDAVNSAGAGITTTKGLWYLGRKNSAGYEVFQDGILKASPVKVSLEKPAFFESLCIRNNSVAILFSAKTVSMVGAGGALTGLESALYDAWENYKGTAALLI